MAEQRPGAVQESSERHQDLYQGIAWHTRRNHAWRQNVTGSAHAQLNDTRGRLLALLCSADRTTSEMARELGISANGIRWHLERLEQEGLIERRVVRQRVGKPPHEYRLTAEGSRRLSRAYLPVLSGLLTLIAERAGAADEETLLREVGRMLARQHSRPEGTLRVRLDAAVDRLGELGGISSVREESGGFAILGACCPLRSLVPHHPLACKAIEGLVEEYIGAPVREQCEKGDPPACRLLVGAPTDHPRAKST